jgi:hypothetical protein
MGLELQVQTPVHLVLFTKKWVIDPEAMLGKEAGGGCSNVCFPV